MFGNIIAVLILCIAAGQFTHSAEMKSKFFRPPLISENFILNGKTESGITYHLELTSKDAYSLVFISRHEAVNCAVWHDDSISIGNIPKGKAVYFGEFTGPVTKVQCYTSFSL